jgi:hypothetical protein
VGRSELKRQQLSCWTNILLKDRKEELPGWSQREERASAALSQRGKGLLVRAKVLLADGRRQEKES